MSATPTAAVFPQIDDALLGRLDRALPRYTSYPTAPSWSPEYGPREHAQSLADAARSDAPLSLYVHLPFCEQLCSYCACNVVVTRDHERVSRYLDTVSAELALLARHLGDRRRLSRVHFGGGTPTHLDERQLAALWAAIVTHFHVEAGAELAIEVDPVVTRPSQIDLLASFGFNRISFGVQDFSPEVQAAVHRIQTVEDTARAVEHARAAGFTSVNFDLIYGLPFQYPHTWKQTLGEVIALAPDRLAIYSFAYLPDLHANQRRLPAHGIPDGKAKLELLRLTHECLVPAGYQAIGIDHFARESDELSRARNQRRLWRDFQGYTVRRAGDTVAVGASGISTLDGAIAQSHKRLGEHASAVHAGQLPTARGLRLDADDRRRRDVIVQLMCNDWVDLGADAATTFAPELERLRALEADGLCTVSGNEISITPLGRLFARLPAAVFDTYLTAAEPTRPRYSRVV